MSVEPICRAPIQDLPSLVDAVAARTGAWVIVESAGLVLAHGPGASACPPTVAAALVHKRTSSLRSAVTWRRGTMPLHGQLDGVSVLAADLGDGATAWFIDGHDGDLQIPLLAGAVHAEPIVKDNVVDELLHPRRPARPGAAPQALLVAVQADVHVAGLTTRVRPLLAGSTARMHVEGDLLLLALPLDADVSRLAEDVRRAVPSAVMGVARVRPDAADWVTAAGLALASLAAARTLGCELGDPLRPEVAVQLLVREAQDAVDDLVAALPAHPLTVLREYDTRCGSDLVATLTAWCRSGFDVAETATALHLHSNTLRYRLKRAKHISGIDPGRPRQRLLLQLLLDT